MTKAITSLASTALVETGFLVESYFAKRPQLLTRV
jgi:hypothetical protein